jgi:type III pantothenate kinase
VGRVLLAIDAGNTNIVFAVFDGDRMAGAWRISTDARRTGDEYAVLLTQLLASCGLAPSDIDAAILSSVVPLATANLVRLCERHFATAAMIVGRPGVALPARNLVERPEEVGADRLVNAVAAAHAFEPPLIVIDFGTATTFDVVDRNGDYRGGVIAPGINLSMEALHAASAKLPKVDVAKPARVIGSGTVGAMQSGIYWGYIGLIEGLVARIRHEFGAPMKVIATGGLAPLFADATAVIDTVDSDLTLRGLLLIHRFNTKSPA